MVVRMEESKERIIAFDDGPFDDFEKEASPVIHLEVQAAGVNEVRPEPSPLSPARGPSAAISPRLGQVAQTSSATSSPATLLFSPPTPSASPVLLPRCFLNRHSRGTAVSSSIAMTLGSNSMRNKPSSCKMGESAPAAVSARRLEAA